MPCRYAWERGCDNVGSEDIRSWQSRQWLGRARQTNGLLLELGGGRGPLRVIKYSTGRANWFGIEEFSIARWTCGYGFEAGFLLRAAVLAQGQEL